MKRLPYEPNRAALSTAPITHTEPPDQIAAHEVATFLRDLFYAWPTFNELGTTVQHSYKRNESTLITTRRGTRERFCIIIRKLHAEEDIDDVRSDT